MWYGSKYSMAVQAEMLCLFSRSLPPVLSCDWFSPDFQQWETSVEQLILNALLTAWLSPKVKRGSPYHPTVMTELACVFFFLLSFFCFKDAELSRCHRRGGIQTCFHFFAHRKHTQCRFLSLNEKSRDMRVGYYTGSCATYVRILRPNLE